MLTDNFDLKVITEKKGITQAEIGNVLGVTRATINRWMNNPDLSTTNKNRILNAVKFIEQTR